MLSRLNFLRGYQHLQNHDDEHSYPIPMSRLPSSTRPYHPPYSGRSSVLKMALRHLSFRQIAILAAGVFLLICGIILSSGIPPCYDDIWQYERSLPQYNLTEALADVKSGKRKYLWFEKNVEGRGLNNVLQEALIMNYVAYSTNRAFVFEDYVWSKNSPFSSTVSEWSLTPSRTPLSAFISGPTTGGPFGRDSSIATRSVHLDFFNSVCPPSARTVVSSADSPTDSGGKELVDWWVDKLSSVESDPCVVVDSSKEIFDFHFFGSSKHVVSVFELLRRSPILTDFSWSPLVLSAILRNFAIFNPPNLKDLHGTSQHATMKGLVAVHLRRGDFQGHCKHLFKYRSLYMGLNTYPGILDSFDPEVHLREAMAADKIEGHQRNEDRENDILRPYYQKHCFPSIEQIVQRLRVIREENPGSNLNRVYALSNGHASWLRELGRQLKADGWGDVKSTIDLRLDGQQKYVSGAIDMAIAEKAEVFVGNGFSSLSSDVVMFRLTEGIPASSNHFL
ncbi:hypothetical protein D9758_010219 [Tetrapyrgos nigripes]|uniref:Uncharacterized protein n=1 Tax=Tetrapyrgos nigripes TaxID=182062 RepID=A0A8H5CXJ6_9AGAR|nr:hypothetical protein D9758_010219 [Tetrapyrgos nigripes]